MGSVRARLAVTGVGIVSALGADARTTFRRLGAGDRGIRRVTLFDVSGQRSELAAEISDLRVEDVAPRAEACAWSRSDALAVLAARDALASAGTQPGVEPLSLVIGATTGGMYEAETALLESAQGEVSEAAARRLMSYPLSASGERIAAVFGPLQRLVTVCSACSSGANAVVQAAAWLSCGRATRVLAGGTDALSRLTFAGFNALGATDPHACRPFDVARAGLTLGEGAGFLVLERERDAVRRGARVLAWLTGWASGAEAHHLTNPQPSGATATRLIRQALTRAGLSPAQLDYVNAHGTGTPQNDAMEAAALCQALGTATQRVRVSSSKGQIGHTLGAAGAVEAGLTVLAIDAGLLPPTGGLTVPDPDLPLCHVRDCAEQLRVRAALSNSFGFGGSDTVLVFEHAAAEGRKLPVAGPTRVVVSAAVSWGPRGPLEGAAVLGREGTPSPAAKYVPAEQARAQLDPARSRRFDDAAALVTAGAERALAAAGLSSAGVGLVVGTAFGNVERAVRFLRRMAERGARMAPPAEFPHLLPSAALGNASVYLGLSGPVVAVADVGTEAEAAVLVAKELLELGLAHAIVAGSAAPRDRMVARVLAPLFGGARRTGAEGAAWVVLETRASARGRAARVLAEVVAAVQCDDDALTGLAGLLRAPAVPRRALLVFSGDEQKVAGKLSGLAWQSVARQDARGLPGCHAASGGLALAAGAALVADSTADEVLVCGLGQRRLCAVHLVRERS
jgi:3-oxoacyl-[acyl-carrier-protein] synthase II